MGVGYAALCMIIPFYAAPYDLSQPQDFWCFSGTAYFCIVLVCNMRIVMETRHWVVHAAVANLFGAFLLFFFASSGLGMGFTKKFMRSINYLS